MGQFTLKYAIIFVLIKAVIVDVLTQRKVVLGVTFVDQSSRCRRRTSTESTLLETREQVKWQQI